MKKCKGCMDELFENIEKIVHMEEEELVKVKLVFSNGNEVVIRRVMEDGNDC